MICGWEIKRLGAGKLILIFLTSDNAFKLSPLYFHLRSLDYSIRDEKDSASLDTTRNPNPNLSPIIIIACVRVCVCVYVCEPC